MTGEASRTDPNRRCTAVRRDGQPCRAPATVGNYCFAHAPGRAAERVAARERGGRHSAKVVRLRGLMPPRLLPVYDRLEKALGEVHDGTLPAGRALAMAALARAMVATLSAGELEERLRRVEAATKAKGEA